MSASVRGETEAQGRARQWMLHSPALPRTACSVEPGGTSGPVPPGCLDCPALLKALGRSSLRWPAGEPSRASVGPGAPGGGTWQVGERPPRSWPRPCHRGHLGGHPVGRRLLRPLRTSLGMTASLSCSCCWSPGLTGTERPVHPAIYPAGLHWA